MTTITDATAMPRRIWIEPECCAGATEYVRADLTKPRVKKLEWRKSHILSWNGDYHTVPTWYTVRCADENGWRWQGLGAHGYERSPKAAKAAAQADFERRILSALEGGNDD